MANHPGFLTRHDIEKPLAHFGNTQWLDFVYDREKCNNESLLSENEKDCEVCPVREKCEKNWRRLDNRLFSPNSTPFTIEDITKEFRELRKVKHDWSQKTT